MTRGGRALGAVPVLRVADSARAALAGDALRELDTEALAPWLARRRWFGAKGARPARVAVRDVVPLPAIDHAAPAAVARLEVELPDGRVERYQLPVVLVAADRAGAGGAAGAMDPIALVEGEDGTSAAIVDAVLDESFLRRLTMGFERGDAHARGALRWEFRPLDRARTAGLGALPARLSSGEQSNSSIVVGDRAILKLYRKLEAGDHPDVEIASALTTRTTFRNTPALLGTIAFVEEPGPAEVAGMLQELVPGARDAWPIALESALATLRAPGAPEAMPRVPFADDMGELGRVTRALHDALAGLGDLPGFGARDASAADVSAWGERVRDMVRDGTELLQQARADGRLLGSDVASGDAVLRRRGEVSADIDAIVAEVGDRAGQRIRHHGDYHLGQVLRGSDGRFMVIDFEGEPARLLAERRDVHSPLRDVAGMLRSFAYAAASAAMEVGGVGTNPAVEIRSSRWERLVRERFLAGYLEAGGAPYLPRDADAITYLVLLFEMEKVFYELAYELNNRPDWAWIPLRGVGRLLGSPSMPRRGS